jgi:hypothetical protein
MEAHRPHNYHGASILNLDEEHAHPLPANWIPRNRGDRIGVDGEGTRLAVALLDAESNIFPGPHKRGTVGTLNLIRFHTRPGPPALKADITGHNSQGGPGGSAPGVETTAPGSQGTEGLTAVGTHETAHKYLDGVGDNQNDHPDDIMNHGTSPLNNVPFSPSEAEKLRNVLNTPEEQKQYEQQQKQQQQPH